MKKIISFALVILFLLQPFGMAFHFIVRQCCLEYLVNCLMEKKSTDVINYSISLTEFANSKKNNHTLILNNEHFEIAAYSITGNMVKVTLMHGEQEDNLLRNIIYFFDHRQIDEHTIFLAFNFTCLLYIGNRFLIQYISASYKFAYFFTTKVFLLAAFVKIPFPPPRLG